MRKAASVLALLAGVGALLTAGSLVLASTLSGDPERPGRITTTVIASTFPPPPGPDPVRVAYAARIRGSRAVVAMAVKGDDAIAYVCDGRRLGAWLRGRVYPEGLMRLQGARATLTGSVQGTTVLGAIDIAEDVLLAFEAPRVGPPYGLYRAKTRMRGADLEGGWILLPDGGQVGFVDYETNSGPAPRLVPGSGSVTVAGESIPVSPADPSRP
ncbi:hypothetical protein [Actinomadura rubrisoli]|uniref:Uncharacterized protein n=1 Tax=Actinomadura rubrisoli TaxID=2530368 RepID=A0A4R5CBP8_9ACTN|nr:hypothetical protein [Actinomadura rubrisoli]TDD95670.1 hypothetical protein E1298_04670 [Actinomadura rubrisoli]